VNPLRIAVLASGRGSHVAALLAAIERGDLDARLVAVVSNNSSSGALGIAREHGVPAHHISGKTHDDPGRAILTVLEDADTELLVLAGYLKKLDPRIVAAFEGRALNIHPGPLPEFGGKGMYGLAVHEAVLKSGANATAVTVHRVTAEYDEGEHLEVRPVPIEPGDTAETLAARVLRAEHDLYWRVIAQVGAELRR
jgi:phosphoribosylglycinamide formyltransferase-1